MASSPIRFPLALVLALLSLPAAGDAADGWAEVIAEQATRDEVVAALGAPEIEFTTFVERGVMPLQLSPSLPAPPAPGEEPSLADDELLRVLEYKGMRRGLAFQVVLKDGKAWYCVAPPLPDETDLASVTKKYGATEPAQADVLIADLLRSWEILPYPKRKRTFVRAPGAEAIDARLITR